MKFDLSKIPSHMVASEKKKGGNLPPAVAVGDGATYRVGSDRYPYTVIEVRRNGRQLVLQADDYKLIKGDWLSQEDYEFTPNPDGATMTVNWAPSRKRFGGKYSSVSVGDRDAYRDPHF